jgi:hypothetical protein
LAIAVGGLEGFHGGDLSADDGGGLEDEGVDVVVIEDAGGVGARDEGEEDERGEEVAGGEHGALVSCRLGARGVFND